MSRKVKVGVCLEARSPRMALLRALADSDYFDVVALAPNRELFVPLCAQLFPDMIIIDERTARGAPGQLAHEIAQGRRIVPVVVTSGRGQSVTNSTELTVKLLHRSDPNARNDVETALFAAATPIITTKRTYLSGELQEQAQTLRQRAVEANIRTEVTQMGSWPLDLILLVDDGGTLRHLTQFLGSFAALPVPVLLAIDSAAVDHSSVALAAPELCKPLTAPISVRQMSGLYLVPRDRVVQLSGEDLYVGPGELNVEYLLASMAWLKSGGLSVVLSSDRTERTTTLAGVAAGGGLVAMLDPSHAPRPRAARASADWPVPPLLLAPDELRWLLQSAVARKG